MSETGADSIIDNIRNMLRLPSTPSNPSLFRVGDHLRRIKPEAYDPEIIAIGPFHRYKSHLQNMEQQKTRYLELLLGRRDESSLERCVTTILQLKDRARECYAEDIHLNDDAVVQMLILDGCFIIEFLRKCLLRREDVDRDDPIFQYGHIQSQLFHDLMLFENQIPFFINGNLFNVINRNNGDNINSLIRPLLQNSIFPVRREDLPEVPDNAHHLLGIVHHNQCSSFGTIFSQMNPGNPDNMVNINSAVELKEAGISFKKSEGSPQKYVTDYVLFMHCLVHFPEDAKLLRIYGIVDNLLGSDEMFYHVINQLGKNIIISEKFSYSNIFDNVNNHCRRKWNIRMATLRRKYLNSPWALISVFAATFLLVLTIIQATFAILSYRNDHLKNGN